MEINQEQITLIKLYEAKKRAEREQKIVERESIKIKEKTQERQSQKT